MKILKRGNRNQYSPPVFGENTRKCPVCGCLFVYSDNEVRLTCEEYSDSLGDMYRIIDCPWCSKELMA